MVGVSEGVAEGTRDMEGNKDILGVAVGNNDPDGK